MPRLLRSGSSVDISSVSERASSRLNTDPEDLVGIITLLLPISGHDTRSMSHVMSTREQQADALVLG